MKGIRGEREFVRLLLSRGIVAIRIPASGAARKDVLPDVIAAYKGRIALFEVKHAQQAYIPKARLEALSRLAEHFNGRAFVAFRPKGTSDYYIIPVEEAPSVITPDKAKRFEHVEAFINSYFLRKPNVIELIESLSSDDAETDIRRRSSEGRKRIPRRARSKGNKRTRSGG